MLKPHQPLVTFHVDPEKPMPLNEAQRAAWDRIWVGAKTQVDLAGVTLLTENDWLSPAVAALVMAAARVSGYFGPSVDDPNFDAQEREMFINLESSLAPFLRKIRP